MTALYFERISFPFKIPELYQGLAQAEGIATVEEDAIVLEYQVQDAMFGVVKSDIKQLRIPLDAIGRISLKKVLWFRYVVIQTDSLAIPSSIPGYSGTEIKIRVKKEEKLRAAEAISRIALRMSEIKLERIENW